jgi:hypothetical protein
MSIIAAVKSGEIRALNWNRWESLGSRDAN